MTICEQCSTPFPKSTGRGRPAKRCLTCRTAGPAPKSGAAPIVVPKPAVAKPVVTIVKNDPNEAPVRPDFQWDEDGDVIVVDGPAPVIDTGHVISDFAKGSRVKIPGANGTYRVHGEGSDGSVLCWGGDVNPNGCQGWRSFMPNRLMVDKRKHAKLQD